MATYSNLYIDQGSNFEATIDLSQTVGTLDLVGYTGAATLAKSYDGTTKGTFLVTANTTKSELVISMTSAETAVLKPGRYVYDVILRSPSDVITRVLEGQVDVTPGVTFDITAPEFTAPINPSSNIGERSLFKKTNVAQAENDAYAFIELNQYLTYDDTTNSSITVNVDLRETVHANAGTVRLFLTTETFARNLTIFVNAGGVSVDGHETRSSSLVEGPNTVTLSMHSAGETEGTFKYLGIVYEDSQFHSPNEPIEFELSNLEIESSTHPEGFTIGFKTPKAVLNGNQIPEGDENTAFAFDSISSPTALFKS